MKDSSQYNGKWYKLNDWYHNENVFFFEKNDNWNEIVLMLQ